MHSDGPIALSDADANYRDLPSYITGRSCERTQMGPLHQQMLLPITSLWPITFLGGTANALRWAYCTGGCCCQLFQFGPSDFWEALPMHLDGPISLSDAAANYFALAHYISGMHY